MSVRQGGMFGCQPKAQYSKETADLLKTMMKESKLTNFQQRQIKDSMQGGDMLPLRVNPHHSKDGPSTKPKKKMKVVQKPSGLKSRQTIQLEIASDTTEPYKPPPQKYNSTKEKERLNDILVFGTDKPIPKPKPKPVVMRAPRDRFDEIQEEIAERRAFLGEMEDIGQGAQYRQAIETEISQYIREMEVIDKKRNSELARLREAAVVVEDCAEGSAVVVEDCAEGVN